MRVFFIIISLFSCTAAASACNVPVFRYALERWRPDAVEVVVFHNGPLNDIQQTLIAQWDATDANVAVAVQCVDQNMDDSVGLLWEELRKQPDVELPHVVVRSTVGLSTVNNWHGSLDAAGKIQLLNSPIRESLSQRLLDGHSAVWLVLKSGNKDRNKAVVSMLNQELERLSKEIPLPEGIGLPGSELFSEIPLLMKFSVLEIDPDDSSEQFLTELLTGFEPDSIINGEPLVVPVFGRGRALEVIPADQVNDGLIEDLTLFLCGACSCQVKERNPGFDLLMSAPWEAKLFGEDVERLAPQMVSTSQEPLEPKLLEIPPGKAAAKVASIGGDSTADLHNEHTSSLFWAMVVLVLAVMGILVGHSIRS